MDFSRGLEKATVLQSEALVLLHDFLNEIYLDISAFCTIELRSESGRKRLQ